MRGPAPVHEDDDSPHHQGLHRLWREWYVGVGVKPLLVQLNMYKEYMQNFLMGEYFLTLTSVYEFVVCVRTIMHMCICAVDAIAVKPVDVVITGLNTILPLMSEEILKVCVCVCVCVRVRACLSIAKLLQ